MPAPLTAAQRTTLARAREAAGLSQSDVARAIGATRQYVNGIESGRKEPSLDALERIAAAVGLEVAMQPARVTLRRRRS